MADLALEILKDIRDSIRSLQDPAMPLASPPPTPAYIRL
jgi:hypothetical protein